MNLTLLEKATNSNKGPKQKKKKLNVSKYYKKKYAECIMTAQNLRIGVTMRLLFINSPPNNTCIFISLE